MADNGRIYDRPVHGGLNAAELESLGLRPEDVIDFSASINPLGPSTLALDAARRVNLAEYPDPDCLKLRDAIGRELGVEMRRILPGNGSTELIHLICRAFLGGGDAAVVFAPTFGEYAAACRMQGIDPVSIQSSRDAFKWDIPAAIDRISNIRPKLAFLCNPNNPTGIYLAMEEVLGIAASLGESGLLVLDEAYVSFVEESWDSTHLLSMGNVALLRSMTKDYALTGLRLGYMLAPAEVVEQVGRFQYSWSVNAPAQAAGISAISDREQVERGKEAVRQGKEYLENAASSLGLECLPASANFLLFRVGRASELRSILLKRYGLCVRDCTSFGLPEYIRVGVRTMDDNRKLANALADVVASGEWLA